MSLPLEKRKKWYEKRGKIHVLEVGDRVAVFDHVKGGIGVVTESKDGEMYDTMFSPESTYHKKTKDVVWNEWNWYSHSKARNAPNGYSGIPGVGLARQFFRSRHQEPVRVRQP